MRKRLIVNADDFGYTPGINRAIVECAQPEQGILTSATLMACGSAFNDAIHLSQTHAFGIGCHVVLVDGNPITDPADLPALAPGGSFRNSIMQIASDAMLNRTPRYENEIEREAFAQIQRLQQAGIQPTHIDSHKHSHLFPSVLRPLLRGAKRAGIHRVRNPIEPSWTLANEEWLAPANLFRKLEVTLLRQFERSFRRICRDEGFTTTDGVLGVITTGTLNERILCHMLDRTPPGTWELVCHPGYNDAALQSLPTRLRASRDIERQALTSPAVRAAVERNGIELISFADLEDPASSRSV